MTRPRNVLFIMCDQLRADHLSCYGHPHLHTPNIDALAARGVVFDRAYVQSPVCGPSRMSYYTGRYMHAHGVSWNFVPLKAGEMTIGDHLRPLGVRSVLVGKTHMRADHAGMSRMGIDPDSAIGVRMAECGFEPFERDDGIHPYSGHDPDPNYSDYLRAQGFGGDNPWEAWANTVVDRDGTLRSGWYLKYSHLPARIPNEHAETPYTTRRAIDFLRQAGDQPWLMHLSYIKPHWPCIAPAPYHAMYGAADVLPAVRSGDERRDPHPLYREFMDLRVSRAFSRDEVRAAVIPAYMGLITEIDDAIGVLMAGLAQRGLLDSTLIVFTSDHGDYLGDHWLGEKDLFHDPSVKIPLIVVDPSPAADATRGAVCDALVESIDLAPTFVEFAGGSVLPNRLEGRALQPLLHGRPPANWREAAISEYDFSMTPAARALGVAPIDARAFMVRDERFKYVYVEGLPPMLFDLVADPQELVDLGRDPHHAAQCERMFALLNRWARRQSQRTTISDAQIEARRGGSERKGILIGYWDEAELPADVLHDKWRGALARREE